MPIEVDKTYYCLEDLAIMPSAVSKVTDSGECSPFYDDGMLPVFVSPEYVSMDTYDGVYTSNKIHAILPSTVPLEWRAQAVLHADRWAAFSIDEFFDMFCGQYLSINGKARVLIEAPFGNAEDVCSVIEKSKAIQGDNLIIMCGRIGNPKSYTILSESGADYVRCGILDRGVCVPMGTLIDDVAKEKNKMVLASGHCARIVADGDFTDTDSIAKALALGADYVMAEWIPDRMRSDGYLLGKWATEISASLRTAMMHCGTFMLAQFKGSPKLIVTSR